MKKKKSVNNPNVYEDVSYVYWVTIMNVKRALISVSDKTNLADFAKELSKLGVEIISTGGTSRFLKENNL